MITPRTFIGLLLSAYVVVGCDKPEPKPVPKASQSSAGTPAAIEKSEEFPSKAKLVSMGMEKLVAASTRPGVTAAAESTSAAVTKVADLTESALPTAQKFYDQAKALIAKQDLAQAKDYVAKLDALRSQLPANWQTKVDELKSSLAEATKGEMMPK
jgi:hypothetical protein